MVTQWRTGSGGDVLVFLDTNGLVRDVQEADADVLSSFLTTMRGLPGGTRPSDGNGADLTQDLSSLGRLVISRGESGEVLDIDPEAFWNGVYVWFRSRGVDYDTHNK